jgi:hypothetical protein
VDVVERPVQLGEVPDEIFSAEFVSVSARRASNASSSAVNDSGGVNWDSASFEMPTVRRVPAHS